MKASVDAAKCQGHGQCVITCPEVFQADDQGFATVVMAEVPPALQERVERAVLRCPERAIHIER